MARPVRQFVKYHIVEMICALECFKGWHRNEIVARDKVGFPVALANVSASGAQEIVGKSVTRVRIAKAWINQVLIVHTEKVIVGGKRVTARRPGRSTVRHAVIPARGRQPTRRLYGQASQTATCLVV